MLEVYAAWTEGAKEADIEAMRQAMQSSPRMPSRNQQRSFPSGRQNLALIWH